MDRNYHHYDKEEKENFIKGKIIKNPFQNNSLQSNILTSNFLLFLKIINAFLLCYLIISSLLYVLIHYYGKSIVKAKIIRNEYEMLLHDNVFINIYLMMTYCYGHIAVNKKEYKLFCLLLYDFNLFKYFVIYWLYI